MNFITPEESTFLNTLYMERLQTAFIYGYASIMVRSYSADLSNRLSDYGRQDSNQALCLHALLCDPRILATATPASILPTLVVGVGSNGDTNDHEPVKVALALVETMGNMEAVILARLAVVHGDGVLVEVARDYLDILWLRVLVADRIKVLRGLRDVVAGGEMFRRRKDGPWRCLTCGLVLEDTIAPGMCPCCKAEQKALARGSFDLSL